MSKIHLLASWWWWWWSLYSNFFANHMILNTIMRPSTYLIYCIIIIDIYWPIDSLGQFLQFQSLFKATKATVAVLWVISTEVGLSIAPPGDFQSHPNPYHLKPSVQHYLRRHFSLKTFSWVFQGAKLKFHETV